MPLAFAIKAKVEKLDAEQRVAFGWASVATADDGTAIVDKQGDIIPTAELERAAYEFVESGRRPAEMHERQGVGRLVESFVVTAEKRAALGMPAGREGWWVGFRVDDDAVWNRVKAGELSEFSIGGEAVREVVQ
jgi:hypothetical protein